MEIHPGVSGDGMGGNLKICSYNQNYSKIQMHEYNPDVSVQLRLACGKSVALEVMGVKGV